jgi:hypothetical protein
MGESEIELRISPLLDGAVYTAAGVNAVIEEISLRSGVALRVRTGIHGWFIEFDAATAVSDGAGRVLEEAMNAALMRSLEERLEGSAS